MNHRVEPQDDGHTIVNMNVEGMPWYTESRPQESSKPELSKAEARAAMFGALKAAMLVAAIFALTFLCFLLFCDNVWFKR